jgi:hypothetical protein
MKKDLTQKEILKCRKYDQEHGTDYFKTEELLEFIKNKTDETTLKGSFTPGEFLEYLIKKHPEHEIFKDMLSEEETE